MEEALSSLASGLGFYKHGQEIAADVIASGVKGVLDRGGDRGLIEQARDGNGPVAEIFASALSLSQDAKSQVMLLEFCGTWVILVS